MKRAYNAGVSDHVSPGFVPSLRYTTGGCTMKAMKTSLILLAGVGFATPAFGASYSHCISASAGDGHVEILNSCVRDVHYLYCVVNPDVFSTEYDCDGGGGSGWLASGETAALKVGSTDARKIEFRWFACADGKIAEKAEWDSTGDYGVCRSPGESAEAPGSTRDDRRALQSALETEGFSPGPADGIFGPGTRAAIMAWQQSIGQAATGELTEEQIRLLLPRREWPQAAVAESGPGGVWESTPEDLWGSIAFSREPDRVLWAIVWNAGGQEPARQDAVEACQEVGGSDCSEVGWFRNACGALAVDNTGIGGYGTGWGGDTSEAEAMAMSECESAGNANCQIEASRCTDTGSEIAGIDEPAELPASTAAEPEASAIAAFSPICPRKNDDGFCWWELSPDFSPRG